MRSGIEQHDEYTAPDKPKPTFRPIQRGEVNLAKTFCLVSLALSKRKSLATLLAFLSADSARSHATRTHAAKTTNPQRQTS